MPTAVKIWEIDGDALCSVKDDSFPDNYLEKHLENWIAKDADILGGRVLVIAQQKDIAGVGRLDLLGIDASGTLVIIELKRNCAVREAVGQALDYASWLHSADESEIEGWAEKHLEQSLKDKFCEYFDVEETPEISCKKHRILLVAPRLDASAERIILYLSEQHNVDINAVFFQYARLGGGKDILARAMLVDENSLPQPKVPKKASSANELMKLADNNETTPIVEICRTVREFWVEEAVPSFNGSFRYWAKSRAGNARMVFGVNVGAKATPPPKQLDVWVPAPKVAEVTGIREDQVREALEKQPLSDIHMGKNNPCWIRLTNEEEARSLVQQLKEFASKSS